MEIQEWYTRAEKELKGKSVDSLIRTYNGSLKVFPFLNEAEALNGVSFRASNLWFVQQSFFTNEPLAWNKLALQALMGGVNRLKLPTGWSTSQLIEALENIHVSFITFQINESDFDSYSEVILQIASKQGGNENMLLHNKTINTLPLFESSATIAEQLAYAALLAAEKINESEADLETDLAKLDVQFSISTNVVYEIAKLRAFRLLWDHCLSGTKLEFTCSKHIYITAITDHFFQAKKDVDNNLIRATIQACAAAVGGANAIEVTPLDSHLNMDCEDHLRWARNIQQLLVEESYINQYLDLAKGSFSIEEITTQLVQEAWTIMKSFNNSSSLLEYIKVQSEERLQKRKEQVLVGENKYVRA